MTPSQVDVATEFDRDVGVLLEPLDRFERQVPDQIDLARLQGGHLRRALRHDAERDRIELGRAGHEVVGVLHQLDPVARLVGLELEGAGSDRLLADRLQLVARHHPCLAVAEDLGKPGIGRLQLELDGVGVQHLHLVDDLEIDARHRAGRLVDDPLDRGLHVLGIGLAAVMEFHALADLEGPGLDVVAGGPALGQIGLQLAVAVDFRDAAVDEEVLDVLLTDLGFRRVERIEARAEGHPERPLRDC